LENGRRNDSSHLGRILATLGDRDPQTLGFGDVQEWIAENTKTPENETGLLPSSLSRYVNTLRQLLDFAGLEPNPARSKHVKLPRIVQEEVDPPTATQTLAILERVGPRWKLPLIVLEQTAMRSGEVAKLVWGDVDVVESRFRLPRRSTKSNRPRWVQVPRCSWSTSPPPVRSRIEAPSVLSSPATRSTEPRRRSGPPARRPRFPGSPRTNCGTVEPPSGTTKASRSELSPSVSDTRTRA
jgi:hypothetical protein